MTIAFLCGNMITLTWGNGASCFQKSSNQKDRSPNGCQTRWCVQQDEHSDLALSKLQVIKKPTVFRLSADFEFTSLVNMSCKGILHCADYQIDSPVNSTETVSLPCCFTHKLSSSKHVNHNNLIIIPITGSNGTSQKAPVKFLQNKSLLFPSCVIYAGL